MDENALPVLRGARVSLRAPRQVLGFAFGVLHLERVELRVLDFNHAAIACCQRCGFVEQRREPVAVGDASAADVIMAVAAAATTVGEQRG